MNEKTKLELSICECKNGYILFLGDRYNSRIATHDMYIASDVDALLAVISEIISKEKTHES